MLTNQSPSRIADALAPKAYFSNRGSESQCSVLRALVVEGADPDELVLLRYGRYWQGNNVFAAFGLRMMEPQIDPLRLRTS
jgi:hypothetical protein